MSRPDVLGVPVLDWTVESISDRAMGGCYRAVLTAEADPILLVPFLQLLRSGIEINNEAGDLVWWGFVHSATVRFGGSEIGASLEEMGNRVKARYQTIAPGETSSTEAETDWVEDSYSIDEFGTIEQIVQIDSVVSLSTAEASRDRALVAQSLPVSIPEFAPTTNEQTGLLTITCLGWWWTLAWRTFGREAGRISFLTDGDVLQAIGQDEYITDTIGFEDSSEGDAFYDEVQDLHYLEGMTITTSGAVEGDNNATVEVIDAPPGNTKVFVSGADYDDEAAGADITITPLGDRGAQSFVAPAGGFSVGVIGVKVGKVGNPVDNFRVAIYSDSAGSPNASLANATIAGTALGTTAIWKGLELASPYALTGSTTYWVHTDRTGSLDVENYYFVELDRNEGYSEPYKYYMPFGGVIGWSPRSVSMPFDLLEKKETTDLIADILAAVGEFFPEVVLADASGVYSTILQLDDVEAMGLIEDLLAAGTSDNRRLFARVSPERILEIYEEPTEEAQGYQRAGDGTLKNEYGVQVNGSRVKAGSWMAAEAVLRHAPKGSQLYNAARAMMDEVEYRPERDELRIVPRGRKSPWELGG